ncbi:WecB/TagA/CpsF family glycosyltransferase [Flammeovirgaceae bacterium SG7u.111]|nr:WecB/TagA/CpsF family glycosyltransferase [Flammeovirgaceae bacterium SG7u.132]WPO34030.1 WecB/TagA/CpsF family glycosyltransferase [Flammeovirgaceae bacterium SG7u.111]
MMKTIDILGIDVLSSTTSELLEDLDVLLSAPFKKAHSLTFVNAHTVNIVCEQPEAKEAITSSDFVLNDGIGLDLAASYKGEKFSENLNGTDFTPEVLGLCEKKGYKVFLFGTKQEILEVTVKNIKAKFPNLNIAGYRNGFFTNEDTPSIVEEINESGADVLIVAMGNPKQEMWIYENRSALKVKLAMGVGAFFDFTAGAVTRAPMWIRKVKFEWLYRLYLEPQRMWKRYLVGNFKFMFRVLAAGK